MVKTTNYFKTISKCYKFVINSKAIFLKIEAMFIEKGKKNINPIQYLKINQY